MARMNIFSCTTSLDLDEKYITFDYGQSSKAQKEQPLVDDNPQRVNRTQWSDWSIMHAHKPSSLGLHVTVVVVAVHIRKLFYYIT